MGQVNPLGISIPDRFKTAIKRYGVWPTTVWDLKATDKFKKVLKDMIKDGETRHEKVDGTYGYQSGASVFNPILAILICNVYAPDEGICYDPFAGGGTRAVIAGKYGLKYIGVELREDEYLITMEKLHANSVNGQILLGDSRNIPEIPSECADFLITCPPYWNLERYYGGRKDLSMARTYPDYLDGMYQVIQECYRIMKKGTFSCWVVGLHRFDNGELIPIHHDIADIHTRVGFKMKEEVILNQKNQGAVLRVGAFEKGKRFLIRTHEYLQVFVKGDL